MEVVSVKIEDEKHWVEMTTDKGAVVFTEIHSFPTWDGGDVPADELTLDDLLISSEGMPARILSLKRIDETAKSVKITVNSTAHRYICGKEKPSLVCHNIRVITS